MRREVEQDRNNEKITGRAVRFLSSTKYLAVRPNADTEYEALTTLAKLIQYFFLFSKKIIE